MRGCNGKPEVRTDRNRAQRRSVSSEHSILRDGLSLSRKIPGEGRDVVVGALRKHNTDLGADHGAEQRKRHP